jgi:hypothetical protein
LPAALARAFARYFIALLHASAQQSCVHDLFAFCSHRLRQPEQTMNARRTKKSLRKDKKSLASRSINPYI